MRNPCDECGKRPALMFRRSKKYKGPHKKTLIIKSEKNHTLCRQCHDANSEAVWQNERALGNSDRANFEESEEQNNEL